MKIRFRWSCLSLYAELPIIANEPRVSFVWEVETAFLSHGSKATKKRRTCQTNLSPNKMNTLLYTVGPFCPNGLKSLFFNVFQVLRCYRSCLILLLQNFHFSLCVRKFLAYTFYIAIQGAVGIPVYAGGSLSAAIRGHGFKCLSGIHVAA